MFYDIVSYNISDRLTPTPPPFVEMDVKSVNELVSMMFEGLIIPTMNDIVREIFNVGYIVCWLVGLFRAKGVSI